MPREGRARLAHHTKPMPVALLFLLVAGTVVLGNLFPRKVSFLPGMRYYAGNEQLIDAMQQRRRFEPGEVRVVLLEAQPIHKQTGSTAWSMPQPVSSKAAWSKSPRW